MENSWFSFDNVICLILEKSFKIADNRDKRDKPNYLWKPRVEIEFSLLVENTAPVPTKELPRLKRPGGGRVGMCV